MLKAITNFIFNKYLANVNNVIVLIVWIIKKDSLNSAMTVILSIFVAD